MTFVHEIITISGLAAKVYASYNDARDYRHISEEVAALRVLIDKTAQHLKSTTSINDHHYGQKVLKGCQGVLVDLDCLFEKYRRLASINKRIILSIIKLGKEDIGTLYPQLLSNSGLLRGFVRSCDYLEVQAQLNALLGLHGTANSRISITSIASFAANTTETAYEQFCKDLYQVGVTEDMLRWKEDRILDILRSQGMVASREVGHSNVRKQLETAHLELCQDLYQAGVTEVMLPNILRILRSRGMIRGMIAGSQSGGRNTGDKDTNSSTETMPSFRLSSRVDCLAASSKAGLMSKASTLMLEVTDKDGSTPQHLPASNPIVELVFWKSFVTKIRQDNTTPLHLAIRDGYTDLVELLLGDAPSNLAALKGHTGVIKLLFGKCSIEALDKDYYTALHLAALEGHTATVDLLLGKGASIEALGKDNSTALHLATWKGHTATVDLLLRKGASIEAGDRDRYTALHISAFHGHTAIVDLLLGKGASIEAGNSNHETALHLSAWSGHIAIVDLLLGKGASPNPINSALSTPLVLAEVRGHTHIVKLLEKKAAELAVANDLHSGH